MIDEYTFLTQLYVEVDDFCKASLSSLVEPGPVAYLCRSEVVTLEIFGQGVRFPSERDFYRYAVRHLWYAFPSLPHYSQFNRLLRKHRDAIVAFFLNMVKRQTFSPDFKLQVILELLSGTKTNAQISREHQLASAVEAAI